VAKNNQEKEPYTDLLTEFSQGVNSGVLPILLPKNQAAFAINATFRGGFVTHRPPYINLDLTFPSDEVQTAVETGFFQGAGWYRPDFGPLQIVAQIGGRLFTFTKTSNGFYTVAEITIAGDPNAAGTNQVWMWQSEKWLIITDGTAALPIFYNGVSARRSYGPSVKLGTANAFSVNPPLAIGATVQVTLTAPWAGPYNVPVLMNGASYQASPVLPTGNITLTNLTGTPAAVAPSGTDVVVNPNIIGSVVASATSSASPFGLLACVIPIFCNSGYKIAFSLQLTSIGSAVVGSSVNVLTSSGMKTFTVEQASAANFIISMLTVVHVAPCGSCVWGPVPAPITIAAGAQVQFSASMGPVVILGQLTANFTNPAVGATDDAFLSVPYSGTANQTVFIGSASYQINAVPPVAGILLDLINLTDTSVAAYGGTEDIYSMGELPAGRMGVYGLGQNWMSLTDGISFIASDIVGSDSGSIAEDYRDAVLKTTGVTFFGGNFRLPVSGQIINSMTFTANLDISLGQGSLQIGTDSGMFSCLAPFDYFATTPPPVILTQSLIGFGPLAQNSTVLANSDILFRNFQGLGSLILAKRDFNVWGNTPISREMERTFGKDTQSLLPYGSAVVFDNRRLDTCDPQVAPQGVFHAGLVALNFDLVSSLRGKAPPVYDGLWTGLNALQILNIQSGSESRTFIFAYSTIESKTLVFELLKSSNAVYFDNGVTPIVWTVETPIMFNKDVKPLNELVRITDGELWLQDIFGTVHVKVWYRPDFYSGSDEPGCWEAWTEFDVCAEATGENIRPAYKTRIGLGEPSGDRCQGGNNRPFRVAHFFQFKLEFTGHCKLMAVRIQATVQPVTDFGVPTCGAVCSTPELPELVIP